MKITVAAKFECGRCGNTAEGTVDIIDTGHGPPYIKNTNVPEGWERYQRLYATQREAFCPGCIDDVRRVSR